MDIGPVHGSPTADGQDDRDRGIPLWLPRRGPLLPGLDFAPGFRIRLHHKDLNIIERTGKDYDVPLPVTTVVHELFTKAMETGKSELDHSGFFRSTIKK